MKPSHPGVVLLSFLLPGDISQNALARRMGVSPRRINEIVLGKRSITADTAIGLAEALGTSELFWMRLQAEYDLAIARSRRPPRQIPGWNELAEECSVDPDLEFGIRIRREMAGRNGG